MKISRRNYLSKLMIKAWHLARQGAKKFGGSPKLYFTIALQLIWQDSRCTRPTTVWHKGIGNQYLMPCLAITRYTDGKKQILLPGIAGMTR